jgi:hypothetical protein
MEEAIYAIPVAAGAFMAGLTGLGFGLVAMALLALLVTDMERGAAVITAAALVVTLALAWRARVNGPVRWREVARVGAGMAVGIPLGYVLIAQLGQDPIYRVLLGVVLLGMAVFGWHGVHPTRPIGTRWAVPAGFAGGVLSGAFVSGGPPLAIYLYSRRPDDSRTMIATLQIAFALATLLRFVPQGLRGLALDRHVLLGLAWSAPAGLLALAAGYGLSRRINPASFKAITYALIVLMGLLAAIQGLLQMLR